MRSLLGEILHCGTVDVELGDGEPCAVGQDESSDTKAATNEDDRLADWDGEGAFHPCGAESDDLDLRQQVVETRERKNTGVCVTHEKKCGLVVRHTDRSCGAVETSPQSVADAGIAINEQLGKVVGVVIWVPKFDGKVVPVVIEDPISGIEDELLELRLAGVLREDGHGTVKRTNMDAVEDGPTGIDFGGVGVAGAGGGAAACGPICLIYDSSIFVELKVGELRFDGQHQRVTRLRHVVCGFAGAEAGRGEERPLGELAKNCGENERPLHMQYP